MTILSHQTTNIKVYQNKKKYQVTQRGIIFPKCYQKVPHLKPILGESEPDLSPFKNHTICMLTLCHLGLINKGIITVKCNVEFCNHTPHKKFTQNHQ